MKRIFVIGAMILPLISTFGQMGRDSVLLNERSMDRPITLHGGQMRLTGIYQLGINNKRYDNAGKATDLSKDGLSSVSNALGFEFKYGISNHIQFTLAYGSSNQGVRSQSSYVILTTQPSIETSSITAYKGGHDPLVALDLRAPFNTRKIDWSISAGSTLPLMASGEAKPTHTYTPGTDINVIMYQFNYNMGYGVPMLQGGTLFKFRATNVAFSFYGTYRKPTGEQSLSSWTYQLVGNNFEYREGSYKYMQSNEYNAYGEFEYQMFPWFDILAAVTYRGTGDGWSMKTGSKVTNPSTYLTHFSPGFEIIVTPKFWLRQRVSFPVSGNDTDGTLMFTTTLSYNFFPFH